MDLPPPRRSEIYFEYANSTEQHNITVIGVIGRKTLLKCKVQNLGNKTVSGNPFRVKLRWLIFPITPRQISWIRHRDLHILTVGSYTYTSDQRFKATHNQTVGECILELQWTSLRDEGDYECQISTHPVIGLNYHLKVVGNVSLVYDCVGKRGGPFKGIVCVFVVPHAVIWDGPDIYVERGSTINITCTVNYSAEPPQYIFWFHHDDVINFDSARGGVSVITEKAEVSISHLLIQKADLADSGRYSCSPSNADVASVRVHVLTD